MFCRVKLIHFDCLYHKPFSIVSCLGNFLQYILIIPPHLIPQMQIHFHFPTPQPHLLCYLITKSTLYCPNIFLSMGAVHWSVVGLLGAKPLKKPTLPPLKLSSVHSSSARVKGLQTLLLWVHECHGPVVSRRHCYVPVFTDLPHERSAPSCQVSLGLWLWNDVPFMSEHLLTCSLCTCANHF